MCFSLSLLFRSLAVTKEVEQSHSTLFDDVNAQSLLFQRDPGGYLFMLEISSTAYTYKYVCIYLYTHTHTYIHVYILSTPHTHRQTHNASTIHPHTHTHTRIRIEKEYITRLCAGSYHREMGRPQCVCVPLHPSSNSLSLSLCLSCAIVEYSTVILFSFNTPTHHPHTTT